MRLSLRLFGNFALHDQHGAVCELPVKKARALLAWLALHPHETHARGRLASLFWADSAERAARHSLRQNLASLRRVLGDGVLVTDRDSVGLEDGQLRVDVRQFERLAGQGTLRALERACDLYRGDLLDGFTAHAAPFEEWLAAERAWLHERALETMDQLLACYLAGGDAELAMPLANRLLVLDPLRESAHRAVMEVQAQRGRYTEAVRQYRRCVSLLDRQLGLRPEPDTTALYKTIAANRTYDRRRRSAAAPTTTDQRPVIDKAVESMQAELHHVVALQVQLSDFAAIARDNAPEAAHMLLSRYYRAVNETVERFDGRILSRNGETVGVVFGLPRAQTIDAERAIHCARAIHDAVNGLLDASKQPGARIAIAAGSVVASRLDGATEYTVTGEPLTDCAALLARAKAGSTLITGTARDELPDRFATTRMGGTPPGWQLVDMPLSKQASTAFVGRAHERKLFASALEGCARTGRGQVLLLRGEAGIGKTRLLGEWRKQAHAADYSYVQTRALDFGAAIGHDTVSTLVRELLALAPDASRQARYEAIRQLVSNDVVNTRDQIFLFDLLDAPMSETLSARYKGMEHAVRQQGRFRIIARLLEARASECPVLLAVEDIHWADATTLRLLAQITRTIGRVPVIVVLTLRAGDEPEDPQWQLALGEIAHVAVELPPLQQSEVVELVKTITGSDNDDVDRLIERAAGNPLFLEQLLRARSSGDNVPDSIQNVASARLDRLSRRDRLAMQAASALGERFSLQVLQHLIDDASYDPGPLVAERLVSANGPEFRFEHVLLRDGVYSTLLGSQRRALHQRAAGWYALRDVLLHAEQLERADDPGAVAAYRRAAEEQAAAYHYDLALTLIERASLLVDDTAESFEIEAQRGSVLRALGEIEASVAAYQTALQRSATPAARCRALCGIAAGMRIVNRPKPALECLAEAQPLAERLGDTATLARIEHLRGNILFPLGEIDGCQRSHEQALSLARKVGSAELEALALGGLGDAAFYRGHHVTAFRHFDHGVTLCRRHGLPEVEASMLAMRGHSGLSMLRFAEGNEDFEAADEAATLVGNQRDRWCAQMGRGAVALFCNRLDGAARFYETAAALAHKLGAPQLELSALGNCASVTAFEGDHAAAERQLLVLLDRARDRYMEFSGVLLLGTLAWVTSDPARCDAALAEADQLLEKAANTQIMYYWFAIDQYLRRENWDAAQRYVNRLTERFREEPLPSVDALLQRVNVELRYGRGERSVALARRAQAYLDTVRAAGIDFRLRPLEQIAASVPVAS